MSTQSKEVLLRLPQVLEIIPVSKSKWYQGMNKGIFPKPLKLGGRTAAWRLSDIQKIIADFAA